MKDIKRIKDQLATLLAKQFESSFSHWAKWHMEEVIKLEAELVVAKRDAKWEAYFSTNPENAEADRDAQLWGQKDRLASGPLDRSTCQVSNMIARAEHQAEIKSLLKNS